MMNGKKEGRVFGKNLIYIREILGLLQKEMAARLSIPIKRYQSYEENRGEPSTLDILNFCKELKQDVTEMITIELSSKYDKTQLMQKMLKYA